jgi:hypothetical protein
MATALKLITDLNEGVRTLVESDKDGKKFWTIEGTWMQANIQNKNGRLYPTHILEREVNRYNKDYIAEGRAVGELGHPDGPSINLHKISHKILEMRREGDNFVGKAKIIDTPMGVIAQGLLENGIRLGVSSRGLGTLKENKAGIMEVQEDFYLATAGDIVYDPSAPSAFVNGIYEGVEWLWNNGALRAQYASEAAREQVEAASASRGLSELKMLQIMERYIRTL